MKRALLFLLLTGLILSTANYASAIETKSSDYVIVQEQIADEPESVDIIKETNTAKFVKIGDKIGIINKANNEYLIKPIIDRIDNLQANNESEYKIKVQDLTGYINTDNGVNFLTNYDDIYLTDKYLKVKKDNKYGLIDKSGNIILKPVFQQVSVTYNDNKEYISGKYEGKYKMFYNTGHLVPENELYTIEKGSEYTLAADLKPIFKSYRKESTTVYQKISEPEDTMVYEIQEIPLPQKVKTASIKKDEPVIEKQNIFSIDNNEYILVDNNRKIGLNNKKDEEIIPAIYDTLSVKRPCEHYSKGIILASRNNTYTAYNQKGRIIAEEVYDKINVYKYGKVYSLTKENEQYVLRADGKQIGILKMDKNGYEFTKTKFHPHSLHKIYELLILFFTIA